MKIKSLGKKNAGKRCACLTLSALKKVNDGIRYTCIFKHDEIMFSQYIYIMMTIYFYAYFIVVVFFMY